MIIDCPYFRWLWFGLFDWGWAGRGWKCARRLARLSQIGREVEPLQSSFCRANLPESNMGPGLPGNRSCSTSRLHNVAKWYSGMFWKLNKLALHLCLLPMEDPLFVPHAPSSIRPPSFPPDALCRRAPAAWKRHGVRCRNPLPTLSRDDATKLDSRGKSPLSWAAGPRRVLATAGNVVAGTAACYDGPHHCGRPESSWCVRTDLGRDRSVGRDGPTESVWHHDANSMPVT